MKAAFGQATSRTAAKKAQGWYSRQPGDNRLSQAINSPSIVKGDILKLEQRLRNQASAIGVYTIAGQMDTCRPGILGLKYYREDLS